MSERHPDLCDEPDHLHEGHRHHREVHAPQPERRITNGEPDNGGEECAAQQRDLERRAEVLRQQRRGVGSDRHKSRVPDIELAARQRRAQARGEDDVRKDEREQIDVVIVADQRQQGRKQQRDAEPYGDNDLTPHGRKVPPVEKATAG